MYTVKFDKPMKWIDRKDFKERGQSVQLNESLANSLAISNDKEDSVKFTDWAFQLFNDGKITVDKSDLEKLRKFVKNNTFSNILRAQILDCLDDALLQESKKKARNV